MAGTVTSTPLISSLFRGAHGQKRWAPFFYLNDCNLPIDPCNRIQGCALCQWDVSEGVFTGSFIINMVPEGFFSFISISPP